MFLASKLPIQNRYERFLCSAALSLALAMVFQHIPVHAAPNLICKPSAGGHGVAAGKAIAKIRAKGHWSKRVETAYGAGWAEFSNAQDTNFKCRKNVSLWGCAVSAKPCTELNLTQSNSTGEVESVRQAIQ